MEEQKDLIVKENEENKKTKTGFGKWLRKTSLTILLILIIILMGIIINLSIDYANIEEIDVTADKIYSLSDRSKQIAESIDQEVEMLLINMSGYEDFAYKYNSINDNIKIEVIEDIASRTDLTDTYGITADTSVIIVRSDDREVLIASSDLVAYDYTTYEIKDTTEEALTNALVSVTTDEYPVIYFLTGHNKYSSDYFYYFLMDLEEEAYEVNELDILTTGSVPDDCSVLMITTLSEDITEQERDAILEYINKGGKIILFTDPNATGIEMPNFQEVLDEYGVSISEGYMLEQDSSRTIYGSPSALLITVTSSTSITKETDMNMSACFLTTAKIDIVDSEELSELGVEVEIIATTGENSYYRTDYSISDSEGMTDSDEEAGSATVGALLKKTIDEDTISELVVYSNNLFITDIIMRDYRYLLDYYNNEDLAMNSIAYLAERDNMITIRKDTEVTAYTVTEQQNTIILLIIFTMPILIIVVGLIVWIYRRRKK